MHAHICTISSAHANSWYDTVYLVPVHLYEVQYRCTIQHAINMGLDAPVVHMYYVPGYIIHICTRFGWTALVVVVVVVTHDVLY